MAGYLSEMMKAIYPREKVAVACAKFISDHPIDWERVFNDPAYAEGMADAVTHGVGVIKYGSKVQHVPYSIFFQSSDGLVELSEDSK